MVRSYKKKTSRADLNETNMKNAICEVLRQKVSERTAARNFNVKRGTLHSRIEKLKKKYSPEQLAALYNDDSGNESYEEDNGPTYSSKYTVCQVFSTAEELELVKYIKTCSDMNYGLTYQQIRVVAYDYACILPNCKLPEKWNIEKKGGIEWLKSFMKRNKDISLRKPESTSLARATGFNKRSVAEFFENYISVVKKYDLKPEQLFNVDETGVTTVLKPVKIVSTKGKKQVSQAASAERGELTTFVGIINAVGFALPPVYVFPRVRHPDEYLIDAPTSSLALGNRSGWMTGELFIKVLEHIQKHTKCSKEKKILLLLDNHESHTTVGAINFCRDNGIIMLSLPPHTSHKLQPLDVGVYGPFKNACAIAFNDWMTSNAGKAITIKQIAHLTKVAFHAAFTQKNITHSFQKPGLWPINRLAFQDEDFAASFATDPTVPAVIQANNQTDENVQTTSTEINPLLNQVSQANKNILTDLPTHVDPLLNQPSTSSFTPLTPDLVRPFPRPIKKQQTKKNRQGKSRIYTDTPEKDRLQQMENERESRKKKQEERKRQKVIKQVFPENKKLKVTRKDSTSSSEDDQSILLESDDQSDDFSEEENSLEVLNDEDIINKNDFLLIKFIVKSTTIHYVGKVIDIIKPNEYMIHFLRRKVPGYKFIYPVVDDISAVNRSDVVLKLPQPSSAKTARTSRLLYFAANLSTYFIN